MRELEGGDYQFEDCITRRPSVLSRPVVLKRIWDKEFIPILPEGLRAELPERQSESSFPFDPASLSERDQDIVARRLEYVRALQAAHISRGQRAQIARAIRATAKRLQDPRPPSASTVMGWARRYAAGGYSAWALLSGHLRRRQPKRLAPQLEELVQQMIKDVYMTSARHSLRHTHDQLLLEIKRRSAKGEIDPVSAHVSMATLSRRVGDVDAFHRIAAREGIARARHVCRSPVDGAVADYPLQRVEVDHTILNWVVICDRTGIPLGRPVLTVLIDSYSGYVLGLYVSFYGPGLTSVSGALRNAIIPKDDLVTGLQLQNPWLSYGVPDEFILDNGLEFHARTFRLMSWELGSNMMFCRVRTPWLKPHVERFFATLDFLTLRNGRVYKPRVNSCNPDPMKDAAISFSNLVKGLIMFVVDEHPFAVNQRKLARPFDLFQDGLERCQPARFPGGMDQLRLTSALSKELTVGPGGIELLGLPYGGAELLAMRMRAGQRFRTLVKWDPDDMKEVYVQDPVDKSWTSSACRWPEYANGLSWNQHTTIRWFNREKLKREGSFDYLLSARARLHEHWLEAIVPRSRADARTIARVSGVTSAKVLDDTSSPAVGNPPALVCLPEVVPQSIVVPDFEAFEMGARP